MRGEYIVAAESKEWVRHWANEINAFEKRLLTAEDGFPLSLTLRRVPASRDLHSGKGYQAHLHAHPSLEVSYVIRGRGKSYFEGVGEVEVREGMVLCQPPGVKHAGISVDEDLLIAVVYVPPYGKPIGPQPG